MVLCLIVVSEIQFHCIGGYLQAIDIYSIFRRGILWVSGELTSTGLLAFMLIYSLL